MFLSHQMKVGAFRFNAKMKFIKQLYGMDRALETVQETACI